MLFIAFILTILAALLELLCLAQGYLWLAAALYGIFTFLTFQLGRVSAGEKYE